MSAGLTPDLGDTDVLARLFAPAAGHKIIGLAVSGGPDSLALMLLAQRWAATGRIDLARAQWVALNLRGLPRARRLQLAEDMAAMDWRPLWAEPTSAWPSDSRLAASRPPPARVASPAPSGSAHGA